MSFVLLMYSTYKTNMFNMPLLLISSVDPFGKSYIVACCLIRSETTASYTTVLMSFKQLFGSVEPFVNTIVTSQETALINAIADQFPGSSHQICRRHLEMNIKKNFTKDSSIYAQFSRLMDSSSEEVANQIYFRMRESCPTEERAYLDHYMICDKSTLRLGYLVTETWGFVPYSPQRI